MLLAGRNAIIYGAGGSVGGGVARAFAAEGARVWLAGRTRSHLATVASEISAAGDPRSTCWPRSPARPGWRCSSSPRFRTGLLPRWLLVLWLVAWSVGGPLALKGLPLLLAAVYVAMAVILPRRAGGTPQDALSARTDV